MKETLSSRMFMAAIIALVALPWTMRATTLQRMALAEMSRSATAIVRAECIANATAWAEVEIWTYTDFDIQETWHTAEAWHGSVPSRITVKLLGGATPQFTSRVSGVPHFAPGEEVVLFLAQNARGEFSIVSWQQGTFRVARDRHSGEESVTQDTATFETFDPATRRFGTDGIRRLPLSNFRARVNEATSHGGKP